MNLAIETHANLISTLNQAVASHARAIKYQVGLAEPDEDLLHELKHLYEDAKQDLEKAWKRAKEKGVDFLQEIFKIIKGLFDEMVADFLAFLKRHSLEEIVKILINLFK
jgi:hypothetical protein